MLKVDMSSLGMSLTYPSRCIKVICAYMEREWLTHRSKQHTHLIHLSSIQHACIIDGEMIARNASYYSLALHVPIHCNAGDKSHNILLVINKTLCSSPDALYRQCIQQVHARAFSFPACYTLVPRERRT